jgi:predicted dienelactone hydrolase
MKIILAVLALALAAGLARAEPKVGQVHRLVADPTAAVRDAGHDPHERVTVWYPAADSAVEAPLFEGSSGQPLFDGGRAAPVAPWRDDRQRYPVILLSHGFGGAAVQTAWLGTVLARHGYVVIAVDHPGNNGRDKMTLAGASLWWLRAEDLRLALASAEADPAIGPHLDPSRLGVAGFSIGGFTALDLAGGRPIPALYFRHCAAHADDGICKVQKEFPELDPRHPPKEALDLQRDLPPAPASPPHLKAMVLLAPALAPAFDPSSVRRISVPTAIVHGDADDIATPKYNGAVIARLLPHASLTVVPGGNHYDFLDLCTPAGQAAIKGLCRPPGDDRQREAHKVAIDKALALFDARLK